MFFAVALFLLQSGTWGPMPALPRPRQEVGVAPVEGRIYVIGGLDANVNGQPLVDIFNTRSNVWEPGPPLPISLHHPNVAAVGHKVYVAGGYAETGAVAATFELDVDRMAWTRKADMPTARGAGAAVGYNGRLYVFGGERGVTVRDSAVFDPATNSWTALAPMPTARNHLGAAVVRGKIYVIGGRPGNLNANEAFDPIANSWTAKAPMPTARSGLAVTSLDNSIFAFGGEGNPNSPVGTFPQSETYNVDLDLWTSLEPMPVPRHGIGAAVVGSRIFIPGGAAVEGLGVTAQSEIFVVNQDLLVPQFVVGGGYSTSVVITNPEQSRAADVTLALTDLAGIPLETNLNGTARSTITITIPPQASRTVSGSELPAAAIRVGSARLRSTTRVTAYGLVSGVGPQLTVYPSSPSRTAIFDVRRIVSTGVSTGIVVVNVSGEAATVTLRFHRDTGEEALRVERTFAAGEQLSQFVHQLFPELQNADFAGTMTVRSTGQLVVAALAFDRTGVVTIPVVPIE